MTWICNFTSSIYNQTIPVITLRCIKTYMIVMLVCDSMTGYVLSKLTSILPSMTRLKFPWFKLCSQLRLCIFITALWSNIMAHFLRDRYSWFNCVFPRLMTCANRCHFSINISLLIWRNPHIDSKNSQFLYGFVHVNYYSPYSAVH